MAFRAAAHGVNQAGVGIAFVPIAVGAGFKEVAWYYGALVLGALGRYRAAAVALGAFVVHAWFTPNAADGTSFVAGRLMENVYGWLSLLTRWIWPPLLLLLALPSLWRRGETTRTGGRSMSEEMILWRLALAGVLAAAPPLLFYRQNPSYYVEGAVLLLAGLLPLAVTSLQTHLGRLRILVWTGLIALMLRPSLWDADLENQQWQRLRMHTARGLVAEALHFQPSRVFAPADGVNPCDLAARILQYDHGVERSSTPIRARAILGGCLQLR